MASKRSRKTRKTAGKTRKTKKAKKLAKRSKMTVKSSNLKSGDDLGRLNFRKHAVTELKKLRDERKEYEQKYLARYNKQRKAKPKKKNN